MAEKIFAYRHFSQIEDLYMNTAYNINFHYRAHSGKIMTNFFIKFKKYYFFVYFLAHFSRQKPLGTQLDKILWYHVKIH